MALANPKEFRVNLSDKMMDLGDMFAESGEQPYDPRSWQHLLIYCPRELLEARIAELDRKRLTRILHSINACTEIAASPGKYDCNPYAWGMANGLRLAQSIVNMTAVEYLEKPEVWLDDKKGEHHSAETMGDMGTVPQAAGGPSSGPRAHDADREARARAGGHDLEGDQQGSGDPPDGTPG